MKRYVVESRRDYTEVFDNYVTLKKLRKWNLEQRSVAEYGRVCMYVGYRR